MGRNHSILCLSLHVNFTVIFPHYAKSVDIYKSCFFYFSLSLFCILSNIMSQQVPQLVSNLLLPELERQLKEDKNLWPSVKGLFIVTVTKKKKAAATW